jgi:hypothetical protein
LPNYSFFFVFFFALKVNSDGTEYILDDDECPLSILMNHPTSRGKRVFFFCSFTVLIIHGNVIFFVRTQAFLIFVIFYCRFYFLYNISSNKYYGMEKSRKLSSISGKPLFEIFHGLHGCMANFKVWVVMFFL